MAQWVALIGAYSTNNTSMGGFAIVDECTLSGTTLDPGTTGLNKYFRTSAHAASTPQTLHVADATSISTGSGTTSGQATTTFENMTIDLTGASHLDCLAGGTMKFINCTITMDATSYITSAGTLSFEDCAITGTTDRTSAAIRVTGGTATVSGTTTISGITNTNGTDSPGGVFNVTGGATLNLAGGTISGCNITGSVNTFSGGGSVAYVDNGTINLSGATVSACGNTTSDQYTSAAFSIAGTGTMNMSSGSITECNGSHGGAVTVLSGNAAFSLSGGTISNCYAYFDGGAVFAKSGNVTMSGGSITGCQVERAGSAISSRGGTVNISGGSITGNKTKDTQVGSSKGKAAVSGFDSGSSGTFTISGNPTISGNTDSGNNAADVMAYSATSLKIGNLDAGANVGITSSTSSLLAKGAQFAVASSGTASTTTNLSTLFNDSNPVSGEFLAGSAGTESAVVWSTAVCQIGTVKFASIADAVAYAQANTLTTSTIEMLVDAYEVPSTVTIPAGYNITLQPATGITTSTLTRPTGTADRSSMFSVVSGATFTVNSGMVLDGSDTAGVTHHHRAISNAGTLTVDGATIQNFNWAGAYTSQFGGPAIYSTGTTTLKGDTLITGNDAKGATWVGGAVFGNGGTINLEGNAAITKNEGYDGGGVALAGTTVMNMSGGKITSNYAANPGGGVYLYMGGATFNMTGGEISNNYARAYGGGGVFIHAKGKANISGGTITGNGAAGSGGGVNMWDSSARLNLSGAPVITGNVQGAGRATDGTISGGTASNVYLKAYLAQLTVTSDLTSGANVGVRAEDGNYNIKGKQFGTTTATTASSVNGLQYLKNDVNTDLFGMAEDTTTNAVVWGKGTCQIIRNGAFVAVYDTLAEACAAAQSDDRIEVFKSHELTSAATLPSTVTGVTITTAPTTTRTAAGANLFEPASGETSEAAVTRNTAYTGTMLSIAGTGEVVDNLIIDGASTAASSAVAIVAGGELTIKDAAVRNCKTNSQAGAVNVAASGTLKLTGLVSLHGNTDAADADNDNNVRLSSDGVMQIIDSLTAGSSIGVTVPTAQHVAYHKFAKGYANGVESTAVAAASTGYFFDDTNPVLSIGANKTGDYTNLDTFLYFKPPTQFQFQKVTDATTKLPLAGATFHIYRYIGSGTPPTGYLADAALAADTANWTIVPNTAAGTNDFTSAADGLVDCGGLDDAYGRIVEVTTPAGFTAPTCEWQVKVDSTQADPDKFVFTRIDQSTTTVTDFLTTYDATTETTTYTLPNTPETGILYVSKTATGDYADKTKSFTFTAQFSENATAIIYNADGSVAQTGVTFVGGVAKEFTLSSGQYLVAANLPTWSNCVITETDASTGISGDTTKFYTCTMASHTGSVGTVALDADNKAATVTFTAVGMSGVDFTNTSKTITPSGITANAGLWIPVLAALLLALAGAAALYRKRHVHGAHRR